MSSVLDQFGRIWCNLFHPNLMWPIHGHYRCSQCLREYPVQWEQRSSAREDTPAGKLRWIMRTMTHAGQ
jgi:hypothetical protein